MQPRDDSLRSTRHRQPSRRENCLRKERTRATGYSAAQTGFLKETRFVEASDTSPGVERRGSHTAKEVVRAHPEMECAPPRVSLFTQQ